MRYRLSKLIPVRFTSEYINHGTVSAPQRVLTRSVWWQWRDRIWRHRRTVVV
jgi:hypothetical protein